MKARFLPHESEANHPVSAYITTAGAVWFGNQYRPGSKIGFSPQVGGQSTSPPRQLAMVNLVAGSFRRYSACNPFAQQQRIMPDQPEQQQATETIPV